MTTPSAGTYSHACNHAVATATDPELTGLEAEEAEDSGQA